MFTLGPTNLYKIFTQLYYMSITTTVCDPGVVIHNGIALKSCFEFCELRSYIYANFD